jgi:glutathione S-transferase
MADDLILHGNDNWTSPYVFSAFVTLKEKGVPFRMELVSLERREHERPAYADASITGRVPALRHGDFWLAESSAIDEYIDEAFGPPAHPRLYPDDLRARARVRMIQAWLRSDLGALRQERPTSSFFSAEPVRPFTPDGQAAAERLVRIAERALPAGASFVAGAFTPADADLALMLQRLAANRDPCPARLANYARAIFARPSVREWLGHTRWRDHA